MLVCTGVGVHRTNRFWKSSALHALVLLHAHNHIIKWTRWTTRRPAGVTSTTPTWPLAHAKWSGVHCDDDDCDDDDDDDDGRWVGRARGVEVCGGVWRCVEVCGGVCMWFLRFCIRCFLFCTCLVVFRWNKVLNLWINCINRLFVLLVRHFRHVRVSMAFSVNKCHWLNE